jgi:hypothetical protein
MTLLIHFVGLQGSLKITAIVGHNATTFFGLGGVLLSHSLPIGETRELHMIGCYSFDDQGWPHINTTLPNLVSISFFHCDGPNMFKPLIPTNTSPPPFPHLEDVMVLGPGSGLREMAKARKDYGVPLRTLVAGQKPSGFTNDPWDNFIKTEKYVGNDPMDCDGVGELVDNLYVGCPTKIVEWGGRNEIMNIWSTTGVPGPVSPNKNVMVLH